MPAETKYFELLVHLKSNTSSACPINLDLIDHLKMRSTRLIERLFYRFCQIMMHLSSDPDAIYAPFGENLTTFVFLSASLRP